MWGSDFRYGAAPSTITAERQLFADGFAESQQRRDGTLNLFPHSESRDFYCDGKFFEGIQLIVIYSVQKLAHLGGIVYKLSDPSGLVGIVRPVFKA